VYSIAVHHGKGAMVAVSLVFAIPAALGARW